MINFNNTYAALPESFYQKSLPGPVAKPELVAFNRELAQELGLELEGASEEELALLFSGQKLPSSANPIALAYSGHQFGHFNPSLGDGRAHLLGEVVAPDGSRFDIQLKGSGRTKYSRRGDGLSWIGPVLREYIVSEAMDAMGIPTTRALAAVKTNEDVFREDVLPGGIFTRAAVGHIRVGTFEYFYARNRLDDLRTLADYAIERHYPDLQEADNKYWAFFKKTSENILRLTAQWMGAGFIHGVMNTDNTSVAGITLDYGPCAFLDVFERDKVFSSIDRHGRYAYSNQGAISLWNLSVFANSLFPLLNVETRAIQNEFKELEKFYRDQYLKVMGAKLGLFSPRLEDMELIADFLQDLEVRRLDFTNSFRSLSSLHWDNPNFMRQWSKRLAEEGKRAEAIRLMNSSNPWLIPRNHQVAKAIDLALDDDFSHFHRLTEAYRFPFEENAQNADLTLPPRAEEVVHQTFCGT